LCHCSCSVVTFLSLILFRILLSECLANIINTRNIDKLSSALHSRFQPFLTFKCTLLCRYHPAVLESLENMDYKDINLDLIVSLIQYICHRQGVRMFYTMDNSNFDQSNSFFNFCHNAILFMSIQ